MKVIASIPIKFNSQKIANKNENPFSDGTPLMYFIQKTLLQIKEIGGNYCCCSNEAEKRYLLNGIRWLKRDLRFDLDTASSNEKCIILFAYRFRWIFMLFLMQPLYLQLRKVLSSV